MGLFVLAIVLAVVSVACLALARGRKDAPARVRRVVPAAPGATDAEDGATDAKVGGEADADDGSSVAPAFVVPTTKGSGTGRTLRLAGLASGAASLVCLALSLTTMVPTQQVGIPVTFGKPGTPMSNGLHLKAPWTTVALMDATVQIDNNLGPERTEIRLKNQSTAYVQNSVRWRIKPEAAAELYKAHRQFENIGPALQEQELAAAMNQALADYNPLAQAKAAATGDATDTARAKDFDELADQVKQRMEESIGDRLIIDSVIITKIDFDEKTQSRIDAYQVEIGNTRIAEQRKETAKAEAAANKTLADSVSKDPNVLVSKCLDTLASMVEKGEQVPVGFSCWPGGQGTDGVIVDSTTRSTSGG